VLCAEGMSERGLDLNDLNAEGEERGEKSK